MIEKKLRRLAVFCGSSCGRDAAYTESAEALGKAMAERDITLVYGGGGKGLMGCIAKSVRENGGNVLGILPEAMNVPEVRKNAMETELIIVSGMHERKKAMYDAADGFIAMPGGIGTLEEISEIYTWRQLGYHKKNVALLNTSGYWNSLLSFLDRGTEDGFISQPVRNLLIVEDSSERLLDRLEKESAAIPPKLG